MKSNVGELKETGYFHCLDPSFSQEEWDGLLRDYKDWGGGKNLLLYKKDNKTKRHLTRGTIGNSTWNIQLIVQGRVHIAGPAKQRVEGTWLSSRAKQNP